MYQHLTIKEREILFQLRFAGNGLNVLVYRAKLGSGSVSGVGLVN
jgi:hypothetical protein